MGRYAIIEGGTVVNVAEADQDYAAQKGWVACPDGNSGDTYSGGNFTKTAPDMSKVRDGMICTMAQLKAALDDMNKLDEVDAVFAAAPRRMRIVWNFSSAVTRKSKLIDYLRNLQAPDPTYSNSFLDNLFIQAMALDL